MTHIEEVEKKIFRVRKFRVQFMMEETGGVGIIKKGKILRIYQIVEMTSWILEERATVDQISKKNERIYLIFWDFLPMNRSCHTSCLVNGLWTKLTLRPTYNVSWVPESENIFMFATTSSTELSSTHERIRNSCNPNPSVYFHLLDLSCSTYFFVLDDFVQKKWHRQKGSDQDQNLHDTLVT